MQSPQHPTDSGRVLQRRFCGRTVSVRSQTPNDGDVRDVRNVGTPSGRSEHMESDSFKASTSSLLDFRKPEGRKLSPQTGNHSTTSVSYSSRSINSPDSSLAVEVSSSLQRLQISRASGGSYKSRKGQNSLKQQEHDSVAEIVKAQIVFADKSTPSEDTGVSRDRSATRKKLRVGSGCSRATKSPGCSDADEAKEEAIVRLCVQTMEKHMLTMQKGFAELMEKRFDFVEGMVKEMDTKMKTRFSELERQLEGLSEAVGVKPRISLGDDDADRKRLKERFKVALDQQKKNEVKKIETEGNLEYFFGICKPNGRLGKQGSRMIHPQSKFMQGMTVITTIFLVYTAVVVPVQICMWNYDDPCVIFPTLPFDIAVDSFFLIEVAVHFLVGSYDEEQRYTDNFLHIARNYLISPFGFWFDSITSIPWSFMDLYFYMVRKSPFDVVDKADDDGIGWGFQSCKAGETVTANSGDSRVIRAVKILRILRIARVLKLIKFVTIVEDYAVLYFGSSIFKICRLLFIAMMSVHLFACAFFRVKKETSSPEDMDSFYLSKNAVSTDLTSAYLVCFYYVITTFTTVGYGDISASTDGERVYCIFLFLYAASLFGTLISQVNEIVASQASMSKELDSILESYLAIQPNLEIKTMFKIRGWERYRFLLDYAHKQHKALLERQLPDSLKLAIAKRIENNMFSKVPFLSGMHSLGEVRTLFSAELLMLSSTKYFSKGSIIADSRELSQGLMVITSGNVGVELPMDSEEADEENRKADGRTLLYVLTRGDIIGGTAVVNDLRWAGAFGVQADFIARSHCSVEIIRTENIMEVLEKFEYFPIKCRILRSAQRYREDMERRGALEAAGAQHKLKTKTIFFWTLLVRQILRFYDMYPHKRPKQSMQVMDNDVETTKSLSISAQEQDQIREIFELFDSDGSGAISSNEIDAAMFALGFQPSSLGSSRLKGTDSLALSEDGSLSITLEDFTALMKGELLGKSPLEEIWAAFSTLSQDSQVEKPSDAPAGWGVVTLDGLRRACREYDVRLTESELACMMEEVDLDGDGTVDKEEFLNIMLNAPWF